MQQIPDMMKINGIYNERLRMAVMDLHKYQIYNVVVKFGKELFSTALNDFYRDYPFLF